MSYSAYIKGLSQSEYKEEVNAIARAAQMYGKIPEKGRYEYGHYKIDGLPLDGNLLYHEMMEFIKAINTIVKNTRISAEVFLYVDEHILQPFRDEIKRREDFIRAQMVYKERPARKQKTYLMRDTATGLIKIGKSYDPKIREKTLRSDKPTVDLFFVIEENVERELHIEYSLFRVRGEWFNLSDESVNDIIKRFSGTNKIAV